AGLRKPARDPRGRGQHPRPNREDDRVPDRPRRLPGDERGLQAVRRRPAAGARDNRGVEAPGRVARRDRGDRTRLTPPHTTPVPTSKESIAEELRAEPRFAHVLEAVTEADNPDEPVYVVGGALRDALLGHPRYDLDLVVA